MCQSEVVNRVVTAGVKKGYEKRYDVTGETHDACNCSAKQWECFNYKLKEIKLIETVNNIGTLYKYSIANVKVNEPLIVELILKFLGVVKWLINEEECVKDHKINLELTENSVLKCQRAYQVSYALKSAVEEELAGLKKEGIISHVKCKWASSIVIVPKKVIKYET
ncbi:Hypothetical protein CINCED_3A005437 [Cinara cedri]|uniref:Uncharacterized protein n=1 Tax=Cinara cedri TaxID=506608 RepID=A0A5E4ML58_9HEMI|nr:Hypothetical protein CINCED_3A005437 [Cinara cedri]